MPHSPLPWRIKDDGAGCKSIVDARSEEVFEVSDSVPGEVGFTVGLTDEEADKGNAEFIVEACNMYGEVLAAEQRRVEEMWSGR